MNTSYPDWVLKWKTKGTAIHKIGNHYYLYQIESKWDKKLKRARKITKQYLGKITPSGLIEPRYRINTPTTCKEYGASRYLLKDNKEIIEQIKKYFPDLWREIVVLSTLRLLYQSPLKHIEPHYEDSWLSEDLEGAHLSKNTLHQILEDIGRNREHIVQFLKSFICEGENLLIDLTHIFSLSKNMVLAEKGYNHRWDFTPQMNILFLFSYNRRLPLFYRVLPGNVRDVSSLKATIEESGLEKVVIIGDKGFYSKGNIQLLEGMEYILPLKRNNRLIDYSVLKRGGKEGFMGYFPYKKRFIWYYRCGKEDRPVWVFMDSGLKAEEEEDYLARIETHPELGYSIDEFHHIQHTFGTLALITNIKDLSAPKVYQYYKSRVEIEQLFDTFKNVLEADRSYMRSDYSF